MARKQTKLLALVLALCILLCSCAAPAGGNADAANTNDASAADSTSTEGGEKKTVGCAIANFTISFFAAMVDALEDCETKYTNLEFVLQDGADDSNQQINQIDTFIAQGVDAIFVNATTDAIEPTLKKAMEAGIPVFAVNRPITDEDAYSFYVGASDYDSGVGMAEELQSFVEENKLDTCNIIYIQGVIGANYQKLRQGGFDDTAAELLGDKLNVLEYLPCKHDKEVVISSVQNMLNKYAAGEIDAIVCDGPDDAIGALQAIKAAGRDELIGHIICTDMPTEVWNAIKNGELYGAVLQDPYEQAAVAVEAIEQYLFGDREAMTEKFIQTPLPRVTAANVDEYTPSW